MFFEELIDANRWSFIFGIPLSMGDYQNRKMIATTGGFTERFRSFSQYKNLVIDIYQNTLDQIISQYKLNVLVVPRATLLDFSDQFSTGNRIIVLFSHWENDQIEFADGFHHYREIVEVIPSEFDGLIDLCVCHPYGLPEAIKQHSPNCFVRYTAIKSTVAYWLQYYTIFLKVLADEPCAYAEALNKTLRLLLNSGNAPPEGDILK